MRLFSIGIFAALLGFGAAAYADDSPVVVELYTSQGCSSCPPADALLGKLSARDDVIALALHVDYWDYIGWKDKFANPAFTNRQRSYAQVAGRRSVYTPQMIVNGQDHVVGNRPMDVSDLINRHARNDHPATVALSRSGGALSVSIESDRNLGPVEIFVVRYNPSAKVQITRGENRGKTLTYHNIVTGWSKVGSWNGRGAHSLKANVSGSAPVVVLVQGKNHGPILAAARLR